MASERAVLLAATLSAAAALLWCMLRRAPDLPAVLAVVSPTCRACDLALRDLREAGALALFTVIPVDELDAPTLELLLRAGYMGKLPFFYSGRSARAQHGYASCDALLRTVLGAGQ
jgi:hypothetical protein